MTNKNNMSQLKINMNFITSSETNLTPPLFIEVPAPSQESEQSCICLLGVSILQFSTNLKFHFGIVPTVW